MTKEAREWLEMATLLTSSWRAKTRFRTREDFFYIDMHFYLKDKRSDSHNYKKLLFDALEYGGICTNDKFIKDRTQTVSYDRENPRIEMEFTEG